MKKFKVKYRVDHEYGYRIEHRTVEAKDSVDVKNQLQKDDPDAVHSIIYVEEVSENANV